MDFSPLSCGMTSIPLGSVVCYSFSSVSGVFEGVHDIICQTPISIVLCVCLIESGLRETYTFDNASGKRMFLINARLLEEIMAKNWGYGGIHHAKR